jgi:uncharacterized membrane protein YgcG
LRFPLTELHNTKKQNKQTKKQPLAQRLGRSAAQAAAAAAAAALLVASPACANEFDILGEARPTTQYTIDDAGVLSKATRSDVNKRLKLLEIETGYRLEVVTVRKLEFETDAFAFGDKVLETWFPTPAEGDRQGILLVVTSGKEGAISGGKSFIKAVGDELIDSVVSDNIPIFTEEEKYNQTVTSSVERIEAQLRGQAVPAAPKRNDTTRQRTYKTKEETEKSKKVTGTVVATLLLIAFVVPMLQYYGYTARD